jgi:acetyltransferase-like isoleucine patch superfamily enzyme
MFIIIIRFEMSYKYFKHYILPNLFGGKNVLFANKPKFNQRTIFTGQDAIFVGTNCMFGYKLGGFHYGGSVEIQARYLKSVVKIGKNVKTNNNLFICAANNIEVGDDTLIGQGVVIMDFDAHNIDPSRRNELGELGKIVIGNNVWIGNNVQILKNTTIGENTIIAAGAVVSGTFPANVIIGGVPAKIVRTL